eukprot:777213-Rhodomonas_salina.8
MAEVPYPISVPDMAHYCTLHSTLTYLSTAHCIASYWIQYCTLSSKIPYLSTAHCIAADPISVPVYG